MARGGEEDNQAT